MAARGDKDHDVAAWFGENQGRIAEVKGGSHGAIVPAPWPAPGFVDSRLS
jgi:hypothetical protein